MPLGFIGGYMGACYPEQLTLNGGTVAPTGTYGYVAKTFVSLFGSLVVISAVAASISTASTSALGASAVANRDIYQRLINPKADAKKSLKMSKIIMLLIGAVFGLLAGGLASGFVLAVFMANSGGAWDNAKKYIEQGHVGGKGAVSHKAAVIGDTVGDPFKDTSGPSLNILIKLMSMVSIVMAGLTVAFHLF